MVNLNSPLREQRNKNILFPAWKWVLLEFVTKGGLKKCLKDKVLRKTQKIPVHCCLFPFLLFALCAVIFIVPDVSYETDGVLADVVC